MPLLWISLSFITGIVLASLFALSANIWLSIGLLFVFLLILFRLPEVSRNPAFKAVSSAHYFYFILPAFLFLGAFWYQFRQPDIDAFHIAFYNDREYDLLVTGTLLEPPDYRDSYTNLHLKVEAVDTGSGDLPVGGAVLVRVPKNETYEYGERVRVRGKLKTPPENEEFSYRDYLAREDIHSYMTLVEVTRLPWRMANPVYTAVYKLKLALLNNTYLLFNDPEASLLAGILFGVDTGLTRELQEAFKNTGTSHIIAISGFNMAIVAGVFFFVFRNIFSRKWFGDWYSKLYSMLLAVVGVFFYTLLVGFGSAVVRAAIMGSFSFLALQLGRRNNAVNTLFAIALLMAIINPLVLWDVSFQLSFFATLGIILYTDPLSQTFTKFMKGFLPASMVKKLRKPFPKNTYLFFTRRFSRKLARLIAKPFSEYFIVTIAAQITTIPIMAYHFKRISLISLVANPFILPVQPAVMVVSGLAVFTSLIIYPLGQLIAWVAWPFAAYTIGLVELFDSVPHASIYLGDSPFWLIFFIYATLLSVTFNWERIKTWFNARRASFRAISLTAILMLLFACTLLVWRSAATAGDGQFHITFLDVGSADAILIQTPEGRNVLINGGASPTELSSELGRRLPFFSRKLDWLIIASTQENQLAALPRVVQRYPPENVLWGGNVQASFSAQTLDKYLAAEGIPVSRAEAGQRLELGGGAFIEVQAEGPKGSVLLIQYKNFRALLPIGLSEGTYDALEYGNVIGKVDVLLLADSGYAPSNPPDIIENVKPQLVVLSVAAGDPDGLPAQEVLDSLDGYSLLQTNRNGWITVTTDGDSMRVDVERSERP